MTKRQKPIDPFYRTLYRYVREVYPDDAHITPSWVKRHVLNYNYEPYLRDGERRRKRYDSAEEAIDDAWASGISDCFYIYVIDAQSGEYGYFVDEDCSPK